MGVVIGKGGDNIQRIRDEFHVAIYTSPPPTQNLLI